MEIAKWEKRERGELGGWGGVRETGFDCAFAYVCVPALPSYHVDGPLWKREASGGPRQNDDRVGRRSTEGFCTSGFALLF